MKKLIAMLMAGAMVLALAVPAFADTVSSYDSAITNPTDGQYTKSFTTGGGVNAPTVSISLPKVPANGGFVLNPYKMTYSTAFTLAAASGEQTAATAAVPNTEQTNAIISPTYVIKSESNVKLKVGLTVTASAEGNVKFATSEMKDGDTGNNLFLRVLMNNTNLTATDAAGKLSAEGATPLVLKNGSAVLAAKDQPTIPEATFTTTGEGENATTTVTPKYFAFTFAGKLSDSSIKPWTAADKVTVEMAWSFMPVYQAST